MAITYVSASRLMNANGSDQTSITLSAPPSIVAGDLLVAVFVAAWTGSLVYTAPSGWTLLDSGNGGGGVSLWSGLYYKIAGSSEPSTYTFQCNAAGSLNVGIAAYRSDQYSGGFYNLYYNKTSGTSGTVTQPSLDPSGGESFLASHAVAWHDSGFSAGTVTSSSGAEKWDCQATDGSPSNHCRGQACYVNSALTSGGGTDSGASMSVSSGQSSYVAWTWGVGEQQNGPLAATLGAAQGTFSATQTAGTHGSITATLGAPTAAFNGLAFSSGALTGSLGAATADFAGTAIPGGPLVSTLGAASAAMLGERLVTGPLDATLGAFTGSFTSGASGLRVEMLINGSWVDITADIRYSSAVTITRGQSSTASSPSPSSATFTLDNRAHKYTPQNPTGPYYGYLQRNTQVRIAKQQTGYRFYGEMSSFDFGCDVSNSDQYVQVTCAGILRRLGQGRAPAKSAIRREIDSYIASGDVAAYWPCDEGSGASGIASGIANGPSLSVKGTPTYGAYSGLKCTEPIPEVGKSTWTIGAFKGLDFANGFAVSFLLAAPGGITNNTNLIRIPFRVQYEDGDQFVDSHFGLIYSDTNELSLGISPAVFDGGPVTGTVPIVGENGITVHIFITQNYYYLFYQPEGGDAVYVGGAGWIGQVTDSYEVTNNGVGIVVNQDGNDLSGNSAVYIGQLAVWYNDYFALDSTGAYRGEHAALRFKRLCTEEGITFVSSLTDTQLANSTTMGWQGQKTIVALLDECRASDSGFMYELRDSFGLGYETRYSLYNADVTAAFDFDKAQLSGNLQPVYDDKSTQNRVTVTRDGGGSATYEVTSGPLSTQDPPDGVGLYDASVTLSLSDDDRCAMHASWAAHLGTVDEYSVSQLTVTMESSGIDSDLTDDVYALDVSKRTTVDNPPDWMPPTPIDQIVQGYTERIDSDTHTITFNTSPASSYKVATASGDIGTMSFTTKFVWDSQGSTVNADFTAAATSFDVDVTGPLWSTDASGFDILVGGERMTVTAISGTSSPQTFTVTRSVNGVTKAHSANEVVNLFYPPILAL